ncbi:MAG: CoA pyrophosphatase [Betaproteobacteria bacterium]|nr:CoA pyrophosphatase [Betaproteobacteria bacterium]
MDRDWVVVRLGRDFGSLPPEDTLPLFRHPEERVPVPAAVLVPLVNRSNGPTILLTQRTAHLHAHAGQISFPGGRVDPGDRDRIDTALRETLEETGLPRECVEPLGCLPEYDIATGFRVTPVVGWVEPPFELAPDPFEVAEIFEVPLAFILDPVNHRRHSEVKDGRLRHYYSMPYQGRNIWGATAGMLHSLFRILSAEP